MPQIFRIGSYWVYFWTNENEPLGPVHVHVSQGSPGANATKIWITRKGKCYLCNNNSGIPERPIVYHKREDSRKCFSYNCCESIFGVALGIRRCNSI